MRMFGWRKISSEEAMELGLPVRGEWERFGLHIFGLSLTFICRDVSDSGAGVAQYHRNEAKR